MHQVTAKRQQYQEKLIALQVPTQHTPLGDFLCLLHTGAKFLQLKA